VRCAGGGGRPGGKPTFQWKERKELNLPKIYKQKIKVNDFGLTDKLLADHFDESRGDHIVDLTDLDEWEQPDVEDSDINGEDSTWKKINPASLFGPNKSAGVLEKEMEDTSQYKRYRYKKGWEMTRGRRYRR
jgi:hypothetical protein